MDKMLTLSLVVLTFSIFVFFYKELGDAVKKVLKIPGMMIFLPLIFVTTVIVDFENEFLWILTTLQTGLVMFTKKLASWLPFSSVAGYVVNVLTLMAIPFLPILIINSWYKKKTYHRFKYAGITIALLWLLTAILLTLGRSY